MASLAYKGSITTSGSSEAMRFDKALFKQNPEFRQKAKVEAHIIGRGTMIVHIIDEIPEEDEEGDPMVSAFLAFLERDAINNPQNLASFSEREMKFDRELTKNVKVTDDDIIPEDVTF